MRVLFGTEGPRARACLCRAYPQVSTGAPKCLLGTVPLQTKEIRSLFFGHAWSRLRQGDGGEAYQRSRVWSCPCGNSAYTPSSRVSLGPTSVRPVRALPLAPNIGYSFCNARNNKCAAGRFRDSSSLVLSQNPHLLLSAYLM